jgi:hypothetical protein
MLVVMQRVHISPGKALCRFCGRNISMNRLSTHIAKEHPRPGQRDMAPTLVRTVKAAAPIAAAARRPIS